MMTINIEFNRAFDGVIYSKVIRLKLVEKTFVGTWNKSDINCNNFRDIMQILIVVTLYKILDKLSIPLP